MYIFAYICLLVAFLSSLGGAGFAIIQLWENRTGHIALIRNANWLVSLCLLLASAVLLHALFWEDYRVEYVASYTDSLLPIFYRLTAFWAGQPGSMLFWALVTALNGSIFCAFCGKSQSAQTSLWFWTLFYSVMAFFCLILACFSNPFILQEPVPTDGQGLNPLLQNPGMIFHPPLLFLGYAGFTIPACLGLAQLLSSGAPDWFRQTRPFWLFSWIMLTAGIILGAWWAYMELGWGGYWAWDPVENASLLPWLMGTATIHILVISRHSGKMNRTAVALMALTVVSTFFATYLTRSGIIQSVHAFGDGGVGMPLLIFIVAAVFISIFICISGKSAGQPAGLPLGREGALVLAAWLLLALAAIIALATLWPVLGRLAATAAKGLDASFYNRVCLPLACILLLLLCSCVWLGWQTPVRKLWGFLATWGVLAISGLVIWLLGYRQPVALVAGAAATASIFAMLLQLPEKSIWVNRHRLASVGAHLGLGLAAIGIAFSGPYTIEKDMLLAKGQAENIGSYRIILEDVQDGSRPGYDFLQATLKVSEGQEEKGILRPERRIYDKFGDMQFSEVDVASSLGSDIYSSLLGMDEEKRVLVRISLEPLVNWIWLGGFLMCLLPLAGLMPAATGNRHAA